jgi:transposase-like protein
LCLFADAVNESLRQQVGLKEGILVNWGILSDGSKVLFHLSLRNKESCEDWLDHFRDPGLGPQRACGTPHGEH